MKPTINDLRDKITKQIDLLIDNETSPERVNSICNASRVIISSYKLQLEYAKAANKHVDDSFMQLGGS